MTSLCEQRMLISRNRFTTLTRNPSPVYSRIKTYLLHKSFPRLGLSLPKDWLHRLLTGTVSSQHIWFRFSVFFITFLLPSVLWHCWLGVKKSIRPVKMSDEVLVWLSVWSNVQIVSTWSSWYHCIPKPHHLLPHLNPDWFYLSGAGLPRLVWKWGC